MTPEQLLARCAEMPNGCMEWLGSRTPKGYGRVRWGKTARNVHRVMYELAVGPIPPNLEIDHLCHNRACITLSHLEAVSHQENVRRAARRIAKCPQGHDYTLANSKLARNGYRRCRICLAAARRERYLRERDSDDVRAALGDEPAAGT